jgi:hypothetical protein
VRRVSEACKERKGRVTLTRIFRFLLVHLLLFVSGGGELEGLFDTLTHSGCGCCMLIIPLSLQGISCFLLPSVLQYPTGGGGSRSGGGLQLALRLVVMLM